jgi:hypothetical protein
MTSIIHAAALLLTAAGLAAGVWVLALTRQIPLSVTVVLDFFTAAGILRLGGPLTWSGLATVALTITVRQLAGRGLRALNPHPRVQRAMPPAAYPLVLNQSSAAPRTQSTGEN